MGGLYPGVLAASGLLVGLLVARYVYLDAGRRGLSGPGRLLLAAGHGVGCFGGFLLPYAVESRLQDVYFGVLRPRPIAASPLEWLAVSLATGLATAAVVVGLYLVGVRYGPAGQPSSR